MQILVEVEQLAGRQGSYCMPVIIHVPEQHVAAVAEELHGCKYFGFNRDRVVLLAHPKNPGYFFDEDDDNFKKVCASTG